MPVPAQALTDSNKQNTSNNIVALHQRSGRMQVVYGKANDPLSSALMRVYKQYGLFEQAANLMTSQIELPRNIQIVLTDLGEPNAYYSPQQHAIVISNELTKHNYESLRKQGYSEEKALKTAVLASIFIFYHEAGHMLVHELNLPITGREEDAADQFAAAFLLLNDSSADKALSGEIVMAAARVFDAQRTQPDERDLQDEHSLNPQRFYNLVCMLYGAAPERYGSLVTKLGYSESRLSRCQMESKSVLAAWQRLLEPYLKS
jgi:Putative metallopeptidase